jgi:hypothetical protein
MRRRRQLSPDYIVAAAGGVEVSASERLREIADILVLGLMRLRTRKSSELSRDRGESSLHFTPEQSGRGAPEILQERP